MLGVHVVVWRCAECVSDELCVYTELRSVWAARCTDLYDFNLLQNTRTPCQYVLLTSSLVFQTSCTTIHHHQWYR